MDLRQAILDASISLISKKGLEALSLREVARRLKVTHGAPYYHFADRAEVFAALTQEGLLRLTRAMRAAVDASEGARERLEACGRAYVAFAVSESAYFKVMSRPELAGGQHRTEIEAASAAAFQVLLDVVLECQAAGLAPGLDARALALTGWSVAHGLAALCVDGRLPGDPAAHSLTVGRTFGALVAFSRDVRASAR